MFHLPLVIYLLLKPIKYNKCTKFPWDFRMHLTKIDCDKFDSSRSVCALAFDQIVSFSSSFANVHSFIPFFHLPKHLKSLTRNVCTSVQVPTDNWYSIIANHYNFLYFITFNTDPKKHSIYGKWILKFSLNIVRRVIYCKINVAPSH